MRNIYHTAKSMESGCYITEVVKTTNHQISKKISESSCRQTNQKTIPIFYSK